MKRMSVPFRNFSRCAHNDVAWLEREVSAHTSVVDGMELARRVRGEYVVPNVVAQDEYSHDATLKLRDDLYLAYAMT